MFVVFFILATTSLAFSLETQFSTARAYYFENGEFRVFLTNDEIISSLILPGYNCSLPEEQSFFRDVEWGENGTQFFRNEDLPPFKGALRFNLNCEKHLSSKRIRRATNESISEVSSTPAIPLESLTEETITSNLSQEAPTEMTSSVATGSFQGSTEKVSKPETPTISTAAKASSPLEANSTERTDSTTNRPEDDSTTELVTHPSVQETHNLSSTVPLTVRKPQTNFTLVVQRVDWSHVSGRMVPTLATATNISEVYEHGDYNDSSCTIVPKEIRILSSQFVLFAIAFNRTGHPIAGGHVESSCQLKGWEAAVGLLPESRRLLSLDGKLFQLQMLSVCLTAGVIVSALLAVFLCIRWRIAVRGSRRDTSDSFYVKTFHTKEHHYAADDDDDPYGFPTLRRDSAFFRNPSNGAANQTPSGRSFVNGGFHDGGEELPPPPPELRSCLINDAHFTEVPLHNMAVVDPIVRAHRGAQKSPPAPPIRTVSSGYMSGQSTPAADYHNPQEVMGLPHIPKEDYDDEEDEDSSSYSSPSPPAQQFEQKVERQGRFTVRTPL